MSLDASFSLAWPGFSLNADLQLPARGVTAIFGPSGSGKTTLLRCIAGLHRAAGGRLFVNGERWQEGDFFLSVHRRALGYVFQEASLFPHLTVQGNLDFGARRSRRESNAPANRDSIVDLLGIGHLLYRKPEYLSGGERQRVAIARALLAFPKLLLMDEPLAALDRDRKREIYPYLERMREELEIPILYVSHAIDEVSRLADHLVLLNEGSVTGSGPFSEMTSRLDLPLAQDRDASVVIDTVVGAHDRAYHLTRLDFPGGCMHASLSGELLVGRKARLSIHARDVSIALTPADDSSILNRLPAVITGFAPTGHPAQLLVGLDAGGTAILARISRRSRDQLHLHEGQQVWAQIKTVALVE